MKILLLLCLAGTLLAQSFRVARPATDTYEIHGGYLFAETNFGYPHAGVDYQTPMNTPILAVSDGIIHTIADQGDAGCGKYIILESTWNNAPVWFLFCHLDQNDLFQEGDSVKTGDRIGLSGTTGNSTGPHMHFEVRRVTVAGSGYPNRRNPELWTAISGMGAIYGNIAGAADGTAVYITPDPKPRPPYTTYSYTLTYTYDGKIGGDEIYQENYAIGDVKPGTYTITSSGGYSRTVTVAAGQVVDADAVTSITGERDILPGSHLTAVNYPNPFNNATNVSYTISREANIEAAVYDLSGRRVAMLDQGLKKAGTYRSRWAAENAASGIYILRVLARGERIQAVKTHKMTLLK